MRLLLVDDDEALMEILAENLIRQRYAVDIAVDGETAQEFLALFPYDLIVLDWLLPDAEGIALCRQLRQQGITVPILMLSVRDDSGDKVQALDAGADDYVVKPVDFEELRARIRALLRRDSHGATAELKWGNLSLNPSSFEVFYGGHQLHTTPKEYALLELFLRHPTQVFSLDAIIESIWSFEDPPSGDAVRTHIKGVRQKLKAGGAPKNFIETVYGLGYRLKALEATDLLQEDDPGSEPQQQPQSEMTVALAKAWEAHEGTMRERLDVLEATSAAMVAGQLSADLQQAGRSQAHKLAGSLGCFGFSEGSLIARELERLLQFDVPLNDQHGPQVSELVARLRRNLANGSSHDILSAAIASVPQLLIVGAQASFSQRFVEDAIALGIRSQVAFDPDEVKAMLQTHPPHGVLLWLDEIDFEAGLSLMEAIAQHPHNIPIVVVTDSHDFQHRLRIVQQGADMLLPTASTPWHMVEVVTQTLRADRENFKVVVVDDDVQVLALVQTVLSPWGMQTTTVDHPSQLWSTLEEVQPQILVLDVEMPEANGLELCQVLRADERWQHLPVLFLTVHEDANTQHQAFSVGADDFVSKATMTADLPSRILNRLQRLVKI